MLLLSMAPAWAMIASGRSGLASRELACCGGFRVVQNFGILRMCELCAVSEVRGAAGEGEMGKAYILDEEGRRQDPPLYPPAVPLHRANSISPAAMSGKSEKQV